MGFFGLEMEPDATTSNAMHAMMAHETGTALGMITIAQLVWLLWKRRRGKWHRADFQDGV